MSLVASLFRRRSVEPARPAEPTTPNNLELIKQFIRAKGKDWSDGYRREMTRHLGRTFAPFHALTPEQVRRRDVIAILDQLEAQHSKPIADHAKGILSSYFAWCLDRGLLEHSPVQGMRNRHRHKGRERTLSDAEIQFIWLGLTDLGGDYERLVKLCFLLGTRRQEVGGMRWTELERDAPGGPRLVIPGNRNKSGQLRIIPLGPEALALIPPKAETRAIPTSNGPRLVDMAGPWVFGRGKHGFNAWGRGFDALAGRVVVEPWQLRDVRRTVRTKLAQLRVPQEVAELVIGHDKKGLVRVYNQHRYETEMREALALWAAELGRIVGGSG